MVIVKVVTMVGCCVALFVIARHSLNYGVKYYKMSATLHHCVLYCTSHAVILIHSVQYSTVTVNISVSYSYFQRAMIFSLAGGFS